MKKFFSLFAALLFVGSMFAIDAEIAKGTGKCYDDVTVNGQKAIKIGTSSAGGNMTITVGPNAGLLTFHAVAWKGEKTTKITLTASDGVEITDDNYMLNPNDNIAGTEKNFTIDEESDYELFLGISGADNGAVITISSEKRCVIWGATYEEGVAPAVNAPVITPSLGEFITSVEVSMSCSTVGAEIYYTTDGTYPDKDANHYVAPFKITESTQIRAIAILGDDESKVIDKYYQQVDPWSVGETIGALKGASPINGKFVKGIICQIDSYNEQYGSITYWISDDGKVADNENMLEVYGGLDLNGEKFAGFSDLKVGDRVIVYGNLKIYQPKDADPIYEFDKNNYLVEHEDAPQGIQNTAVETKAVKKIVNGQLVIEKKGVRYNAIGQELR